MTDAFCAHLGFEVVAVGEGQARLVARVRPEHLNLHGSAHGGFLYALADAAFAFASNSRGVPAVALSAHIEYFRPAHEGDVLEAVATETHLGRRVATYQVRICKDTTLVALFTGTVYRMEERT